MTKRSYYRIIPLWALAALMLSGCHFVLGPDEGSMDWWSYCDDQACYHCNAEGCEIPGGYCTPGGPEEQCPKGHPCDPNQGVCKGKTCTTGSDCGQGHICDNGNCIPQRTPCTKQEQCGDGSYCQNGTCKHSKRCGSDLDCATLGAFVCNSMGTCVPGPSTKSCTKASACSGGMCVDGKCGSCSGDCGGGQTCQFNAHCGSGRVCLDGQCTNACKTADDCGSNQLCQSKVCALDGTSTCNSNKNCASGACVNNRCHNDCTLTGKCSSAKDVCSATIVVSTTTLRICHANPGAKLECKTTKDCTGGETCVNAVCRTACGTSKDCAACEDGPVCGKGGYCMTQQESDPKCVKNSQCTGGKVCLNTQCVEL